MSYGRGSQPKMKNGSHAMQKVSRGYKGVLPASIVMRFLTYDYKTHKVSYKPDTEFISSSTKGKKKKHFFGKYLDKGYYEFVGTKPHHQHDHTIEMYKLTEDGEDLFTILKL